MLVFPLFRAVLEDLAYGPGPVCSSVCCDDSGQHLLGCFCLQERQVCAQTQVRGTNPLNTRCCLVKWASYYTLFIPFNFSYMGTRTQTYKHIIISRLNTNRESNCLCRVRAFLIRSTWLTDVMLFIGETLKWIKNQQTEFRNDFVTSYWKLNLLGVAVVFWIWLKS